MTLHCSKNVIDTFPLVQFCINLQKSKARTIKDAYSLAQIDETLECLNGAEWFSFLDLKSGYWQAEMEENSKALTAFTVGPLGFHECQQMPFQINQCSCHFPTVDAKLFSQFTFTILYHKS